MLTSRDLRVQKWSDPLWGEGMSDSDDTRKYPISWDYKLFYRFFRDSHKVYVYLETEMMFAKEDRKSTYRVLDGVDWVILTQVSSSWRISNTICTRSLKSTLLRDTTSGMECENIRCHMDIGQDDNAKAHTSIPVEITTPARITWRSLFLLTLETSRSNV